MKFLPTTLSGASPWSVASFFTTASEIVTLVSSRGASGLPFLRADSYGGMCRTFPGRERAAVHEDRATHEPLPPTTRPRLSRAPCLHRHRTEVPASGRTDSLCELTLEGRRGSLRGARAGAAPRQHHLGASRRARAPRAGARVSAQMSR
jgi:hypothetical protein